MAGKTAPAWPADKVERWPLARLRPYAKNARTHSPEQVAQIAASMREWGWTNPVLVDETGELIAGHGRVEAAKLLGLPEAPVMVARGWTPAQKRAYVLADNQLALNAGWDGKLLAAEVADLQAGEFDVTLLGFSAAQLRGMAGGKTDPDAAPPAPEEPVSRLGDVWILGEHRLLCGDSTKAGDVARLLVDAKPHLMVTDPPYGVEYDADWRNHAARTSGSMGNRAIGAGAVGKVSNDDRADWSEAWALFPGAVAYAWHADRHATAVQNVARGVGFEIRNQIIWAKTRLIISRGNYHWQHEPCWYAVRKGATAHWQGDRSQTTLWTIEHQVSETGHSTQKPVECMRRPILNNSREGDAVYEPFSGSGTTIIAAEMTARRCYAIEIAPAYADVAARRWEQFTGKDAVLEATGERFAEVARERVHEGPKTKADEAQGAARIPRPQSASAGRA